MPSTMRLKHCAFSAQAASTPIFVLAQKLLDWLLGTWSEPAISLPDIYQRSLNAIGDKATAAKLVAILEDHGWLARIPEGAVVSGVRRRDAWRVVRRTSR